MKPGGPTDPNQTPSEIFHYVPTQTRHAGFSRTARPCYESFGDERKETAVSRQETENGDELHHLDNLERLLEFPTKLQNHLHGEQHALIAHTSQ